MKLKSTFLFFIIFFNCAYAQVPNAIAYRAVIRDVNNNLVISSPVSVKLSIAKDSINGALVYSETHTTSTDTFGFVNLGIGLGSALTGSMNIIDWANGTFYLISETDPTGGSNYGITGARQLLSVPYAFHAQTADSVVNSTSNVSSNGFTHYVGELYGGGIVVGVWKENGVEHGLIASSTDISARRAWTSWNGVFTFGNNAKSPDDGQNNTSVLAAADPNCVAAVCQNYTGGGYNDWYLPSVWEMRMVSNAFPLLTNILGDGHAYESDNSSYSEFAGHYWTSTIAEHFSNSRIYVLDVFGNGDLIFSASNAPTSLSWGKVRAVRRF